MNNETKGTLIIQYVNGTEQKFEFDRLEDDSSVVSRVQELLSANQIILELEDRIVVIPIQNIQSMEVLPPPARVPSSAVTKARKIS
ncbi:MAG: hypothetical protein JRJ37_00065 [Deltaproteobacteria bacterium]|nr:hypothetical protein [Deltaproteobacteria bacterium]